MDNRTNLLQCALSLFAARGYDAVGVQEIVDVAGVTKPTLYHYFGSKRGLLEALLAEHFDELNRTVAEAAAYSGDLTLTLERIVRATFTYAMAHRDVYRMQLAMWFAPPDSDIYRAVAARNADHQITLEQLFRSAAHDHGNMRGRHQAYAATFLGMINTYIGLALNGHVTLNDELVYRSVHQYMHGILS